MEKRTLSFALDIVYKRKFCEWTMTEQSEDREKHEHVSYTYISAVLFIQSPTTHNVLKHSEYRRQNINQWN